ncbi:MAG: restriction endonuclease subunit S [Albidovulum sp.]
MLDAPKAGLKTLNHRSDWKTARLKFLFKRETRPVLETDEVVTAFRDGTVTLRKNRREDGFTFAEQEIGYQGIKPGDLVIHAMDGFAGAIGVSDSRGKGSPVLSIATPIADAEPRFWAYYLRNLAVTGFIQSLAKGIRERSTDFRWKDASNLLVNFPDLATQRQIADFLDRETARIDLLIEKKQRFIETLSESRTTAAPTVIRSHGGPSMKDTPDTYDIQFDAYGWSVGRVKHVVEMMTSGSRGWSDLIADEGELFLQSGNIGRCNEVSHAGAKRIIPQTNAEARRTRLQNADTLVCITGGRTGAVGFLEALSETGYVNQHVCLLRPNIRKIYPKLLSQILYSEIGQRQFLFLQYGMKQGLGFSQVGDVRIPIPPQKLQQKISADIDRVFDRVGRIQSAQEKSIDRLKEYRSALITAAVTGQIDVQTYAKSGTPDRRLDAIQEEMEA